MLYLTDFQTIELQRQIGSYRFQQIGITTVQVPLLSDEEFAVVATLLAIGEDDFSISEDLLLAAIQFNDIDGLWVNYPFIRPSLITKGLIQHDEQTGKLIFLNAQLTLDADWPLFNEESENKITETGREETSLLSQPLPQLQEQLHQIMQHLKTIQYLCQTSSISYKFTEGAKLLNQLNPSSELQKQYQLDSNGDLESDRVVNKKQKNDAKNDKLTAAERKRKYNMNSSRISREKRKHYDSVILPALLNEIHSQISSVTENMAQLSSFADRNHEETTRTNFADTIQATQDTSLPVSSETATIDTGTEDLRRADSAASVLPVSLFKRSSVSQNPVHSPSIPFSLSPTKKT